MHAFFAKLGPLGTVIGIVAFLVFTPAMVGTAQANAIPLIGDCKDAPTPDIPGTGTATWFLPSPDQDPAPADPFAATTTTSIYQQYGFAGVTFQTYDLGCGGFARDPADIIMNSVSNFLIQIPIALVAFTGWVLGAAFHPDTMFGDLDKFIGQVSGVLRAKFFNLYSVPLLAAGALWMVNRARKRDFGSVVSWIAISVGLVAALSVLSNYPTAAGHLVDNTVSSTVGQVSSGFAGQDTGDVDPEVSAVANEHRAVLYGPWLTGTFGNSNSAMAQKYGPQLFDAQALTWQQAHLDPDARKKVIEDKQSAFGDIMSKIKDEDPSVYEIAQGKKSEIRLGSTIVSGFAAAVTSAFLLVAGLLMLAAFVIVRLGVMVAPVLLTLGLFPPLLGRVRAVGEGIFASVLGCMGFGIGTALDVFLVGQIMAPGSSLSPLRQLLLIAVLSLCFFLILLPLANVHRSFRNAFKRAGEGFGGAAKRYRDGLRDDTTREQREAMEAQRRRIEEANRRPETVTATATAAPEQWTASRGDGRRGTATPWNRETWANNRRVNPGSGLALPAGSDRLPAVREKQPAAAGAERSKSVPLEPDAIFRPAGSRKSETLPKRPTRPTVDPDGESYVFKPYRPEPVTASRPGAGRVIPPDMTAVEARPERPQIERGTRPEGGSA